MKVAIFGAGGFIGQSLAAKLGGSGVEVVSYSSTTPGVFFPESGVLSDEVDLPNGTNCVIYLAQSPFYRQMPQKSSHLWGVNVVSAVKAAELARKRGVKKFIYASTGSVYASSFMPFHEGSPVRRGDWYALSKVHAEESLALFARDMEVSSVRIFGVYGPQQRDKLIPNLISSIAQGSPIQLARNPQDALDDGGLRISLVFISDLVSILSELLYKTAPAILNLAGNESYSIKEIAEAIGSRLDVKPIFRLSDSFRDSELLADITLLANLGSPTFTPLGLGLDKVMAVHK